MGNIKSYINILIYWPNLQIQNIFVSVKACLSVSFKRVMILIPVPCFDSGDTDAVIPVTSTRYNIDALKLPTVRPWRAWYDDGQVSFLSSPPLASPPPAILISL